MGLEIVFGHIKSIPISDEIDSTTYRLCKPSASKDWNHAYFRLAALHDTIIIPNCITISVIDTEK